MEADFSIELGREDPVLDFPWIDPDGKLTYFDLKRQPELIGHVEEAQTFPELADFLRAVNSSRSVFESAKCDVWATSELTAEEDIFNASAKVASYIDLVFSNSERLSLGRHEQFAKRCVELLRRAPEMPASVELLVRRCFSGSEEPVREGFHMTIYVNGYGNDEDVARQSWAVAMKMTANAILQLSAELT